MGKIVKTTILLDETSVKRAHELGLNISKIARNAIEQAIEKMEA